MWDAIPSQVFFGFSFRFQIDFTELSEAEGKRRRGIGGRRGGGKEGAGGGEGKVARRHTQTTTFEERGEPTRTRFVVAGLMYWFSRSVCVCVFFCCCRCC